jgi:ABC-type multidrug transport system fused ATPase/permease subunit
VISAVKSSLSFMTRRERLKWTILIVARALLGILDLLGIVAIGFIATSAAIGLTPNGGGGKLIEFAGFRIETVTSQNLPVTILIVLSLFLTKAFFSIVLVRQAAFFVANVEARAARVIAETSFGGDLVEARARSREEMLYAIQTGAPNAFNTILNSANAFVAEASLFVIILVGFFFVDPIATLAAIVYFGVILFSIQFFIGSLMVRSGRINAEKSVQANMALSDLVSVFRELFVLGRTHKYVDKIYKSRIASAQSTATMYFLSGMPRYIIEASLLVGISLFILLQALSGDLVRSAGTIGVFLSGGFRLTAALLPLQNSLLAIQGAMPSAKTAYEILKIAKTGPQLDKQPSLENQTDKTPSLPVSLEFRDVSFSYPGAQSPAVSNLSFVIEEGSQVALMGPSGAGKSTIADLITRVVQPTSGSIDRRDTQSVWLETSSLGRVSYVPQRPGIVSGTILDNVALGIDEDQIDRDAAIKALELAHLGDLIMNLPDGIDTLLGKLQDGLSGGQMQRLGLARALYSMPGLLVMDEATSALDAESEAEIQTALEGMRGRVTVVLVAHRLNTIQHADKVILIEDGKVKDTGKFKELIVRNPEVERVVDLMRVEKD